MDLNPFDNLLHAPLKTLVEMLSELCHSALFLPVLLSVLLRAYKRRLQFNCYKTVLFIVIVAYLAPIVPTFFCFRFANEQDERLNALLKKYELGEGKDAFQNGIQQNFLSKPTFIFAVYLYLYCVWPDTKKMRWPSEALTSIVIINALIFFLAFYEAVMEVRSHSPPIPPSSFPHGPELSTTYLRALEDYAVAYTSIPPSAAALSMLTWVIGALMVAVITEHVKKHKGFVFYFMKKIMLILITIVLLGFALCGFIYLPRYQATLWLLFWIIAYPVVLSFTRAEPFRREANLLQLYREGLKQIPFLGRLLEGIFNPLLTKPKPNPEEKNENTTEQDDANDRE